MSTAGRTTWYLLSGQAVVIGASMALNVFSAHALGPSGRGALALALQFSYLLHLVVVGGLDRAYPIATPAPVSLPAAQRELIRLVTPSALLVLAISGVAALVVALRGDFGAVYPLLVGLFAVAALGLTTVRVGAATLGAGRDYLHANLATQGVLVLVALWLVTSHNSAPTAWLAAYALAPLGAIAWCWRGARRSGPVGRGLRWGDGDAVQRRRIRAQGWQLLPATVAAFATLRADRLLIPILASVHALGLYAVAATFAELCVLPVQNYVDAHLPQWRRQAKRGELRAAHILGLAAGYALVAGVVVTVAGQVFIRWALPVAFAASARVLPLLVLAGAVWALSRVAAGLALVRRAPSLISAADGCTLLVTVAGHFLLIPAYGMWGAGCAAVVGYSISAALMIGLALVGPALVVDGPQVVAHAATR